MNNITIEMTSNPFSITYNAPLFKLNYKSVAVSEFNFLNSFENVTITSNLFIYFNGTTTKTLTLPTGGYTLTTLNEVISSLIQSNGDTPITFLNSGLNITMVCPPLYTVTFSAGTIYGILGFNLGSTVSGTTSSPNVANFSKGITSYSLSCNRCGGSYINALNVNTLKVFPLTVPPGYYQSGSVNSLQLCESGFYANNSVMFSLFETQSGKLVNIPSGTSATFILVFA